MIKKLVCLMMSVLLLGAMALPASAAMDPGVSVGAPSAIVTDLETGQILYEKEATARRNPVGLANILTAMTVIKHADDLDAYIPVKQSVLDLVEDTSLGILVDGEEYKVLDLLYVLVLKNDPAAGAVLADHVSGGNIDAFVELMNKLAQSIGMANSIFSNPYGAYAMADENYTDCNDMAKLIGHAMNNAITLELLIATTHTMAKQGGDAFTPTSTVSITNSASAYYDERVTIAKAATDEKTGHCMVSVAEQDGRRLACVLFNSTEDDNQVNTSALYDWAFALKQYTCVSTGQKMAEVVPDNSFATLELVAAKEVTYLCDNTFDENKMTVEPAIEEKTVAPIEKGANLGIIVVRYDGEQVATVDLIAGNDVAVSMGEEIQTPPLALRMVLLAIVVVVLTGVFIVGRKKWNQVTK